MLFSDKSPSSNASKNPQPSSVLELNVGCQRESTTGYGGANSRTDSKNTEDVDEQRRDKKFYLARMGKVIMKKHYVIYYLQHDSTEGGLLW